MKSESRHAVDRAVPVVAALRWAVEAGHIDHSLHGLSSLASFLAAGRSGNSPPNIRYSNRSAGSVPSTVKMTKLW